MRRRSACVSTLWPAFLLPPWRHGRRALLLRAAARSPMACPVSTCWKDWAMNTRRAVQVAQRPARQSQNCLVRYASCLQVHQVCATLFGRCAISIQSAVPLEVCMHSIKSVGLLILSTLLLSACASTSSGNAVDWERGAKHGWIVSTYEPGVDRTGLPKCLADLQNEDLATRHFVKVSYRQVRHMRYEVAELLPGQEAKIDDRIELWPARCSEGKFSRISLIFPSTANK